MVTLQPMIEDDYNAYMPHSLEGYAAERAQAEDTPLEKERKVASEQMASLLPQGLHTPEHFFWRVVAEDGARVGTLWVHVQPAERRAFIYDIEIDAAQRGKGYGEATMRALEERLRPQGITHIGLKRLWSQHGRPRALRQAGLPRRHLHAQAHRGKRGLSR